MRVQDFSPVTETAGGTERWAAAFLALLCAGFAVSFALLAILRPHEMPQWLQDIVPAFVAIMALLVAASVWGIKRAWHMGLRIDDDG